MNSEFKNKQKLVFNKNCKLNFNIFCARPVISNIKDEDSVTIAEKHIRKKEKSEKMWLSDGFCLFNKSLTNQYTRVHFYDHRNTFDDKKKSQLLSGQLIEIAVREVKLQEINKSHIASKMVIVSIEILFKDIVICKTKSPFNRELHKLLFQSPFPNFNDISIRINAQDGSFSIVPLPVPKKREYNKNLEIQFGMNDKLRKVYSGKLSCTISSIIKGQDIQNEPTFYVYSIDNDPNDPKKSIFYLKTNNGNFYEGDEYFVLDNLALQLVTISKMEKLNKKHVSKLSEVSISEPNISVLNLQNLFQSARPSGTSFIQDNSITRMSKKPVLTITVLRGVEIPVREESAIVQPLVEIEWCDTFRSTSVAEGPAPVWHETLQFPVLKLSHQQYITIRLFDQHPIWGLQWLGESKVPLECHREYEEFERWISLSPPQSPVLLLGYVQV